MKNTNNDIKFTPPIIIARKPKPKTTAVFDTYWKFAAERQKIYISRVHQHKEPWTTDPILQEYKFTNAYRATDRTSQFLIKNVIYNGSHSIDNQIFRILVFKIFNKIETWELLEREIGEISIRNFDITKISKILASAMLTGKRIYSAAYIMPSGSKKTDTGRKKHDFHLELLNTFIRNHTAKKIASSKNMKEAFNHLMEINSFGKFLSYQFITDINYSDATNFTEMEFVVAGPGALDGIKKCFLNTGERSPEEIIRMMSEEQDLHFQRLGLEFHNLWGRPLQLIDCQNIFCETDKYSRVAHPDTVGLSGRKKIKQKYKSHLEIGKPWFPPKWKINHKIPTS